MAGKKKSNVNLAVAAKVLDDPAADEAFVKNGKAIAETSKRQNVKMSKRRMTVYLPEELATDLELRCVKERESVSALIERAVSTLLKR